MLRGFLMGDFLRFSLWSGGLGRQAQACAQDVKNAIMRLGFVVVVFLEREKKHYSCTLYFFPNNSEIPTISLM